MDHWTDGRIDGTNGQGTKSVSWWVACVGGRERCVSLASVGDTREEKTKNGGRAGFSVIVDVVMVF